MIGNNRSLLQTPVLILLILFGAYGGCTAQTSRITNVRGDSYESEEFTQEIDPARVKRFVFRTTGSVSGLVSVVSADKGCKVVYVKHFTAGSIEQAESFSKYITVTADQSTESLLIDASASFDAPWRGTDQSARLHLRAVIPKSSDIEIVTDHFDIELVGPFAKVSISNEYGEIKVSGVTEELKLEAENSEVTLANIQGRIDVSTSKNWIRAHEIDAKGTTAVFRNEYGVIEIERFSGVLECLTSYEPIDLIGIKLTPGPSKISNRYGSVDATVLEMNDAKLFLSNHFSNVDLVLPESLKTDFDIDVDKGEIHLTGIPVTPTRIAKDRLVASTDDPVSTVLVNISGIGSVNVKGRKFSTGP